MSDSPFNSTSAPHVTLPPLTHGITTPPEPLTRMHVLREALRFLGRFYTRAEILAELEGEDA